MSATDPGDLGDVSSRTIDGTFHEEVTLELINYSLQFVLHGTRPVKVSGRIWDDSGTIWPYDERELVNVGSIDTATDCARNLAIAGWREIRARG